MDQGDTRCVQLPEVHRGPMGRVLGATRVQVGRGLPRLLVLSTLCGAFRFPGIPAPVLGWRSRPPCRQPVHEGTMFFSVSDILSAAGRGCRLSHTSCSCLKSRSALSTLILQRRDPRKLFH